jgi:hypothetical protein
MLMAALLYPAASAAEEPAAGIADLQYFVQIYNENIESAPGTVKNLLGSEKVLVRITGEDGSVYLAGFETEDAIIVSTFEGEIENWTILVETREDVISSIYDAEDPIAAFKDALKNDDITVTGKSLAMKIKLGLALSSISFLNFFADLLFG